MSLYIHGKGSHYFSIMKTKNQIIPKKQFCMNPNFAEPFIRLSYKTHKKQHNESAKCIKIRTKRTDPFFRFLSSTLVKNRIKIGNITKKHLKNPHNA